MRHSMRDISIFLMVISALSTVTLSASVLSCYAAEVQHIKPDELKNLIETNDPNILVVDTQPRASYDLGHVRGAINFPWALDIKSPGNLPKDKTLILYCDCAHEEDSTAVAQNLMSKFRYTKIKVLEGGWSKWQQLGYPVEK